MATRAFSEFSAATARRTGHIVPFLTATLLVIAWAISGPLAHWSDTWQLVMNTISSAVTFLMVFVIQGSQNRDTDIINAKLNEIIRCLPEARQEFLNLDDLSEAQLRALRARSFEVDFNLKRESPSPIYELEHDRFNLKQSCSNRAFSQIGPGDQPLAQHKESRRA
jgi:low affinity Fe/Cu permease